MAGYRTYSFATLICMTASATCNVATAVYRGTGDAIGWLVNFVEAAISVMLQPAARWVEGWADVLPRDHRPAYDGPTMDLRHEAHTSRRSAARHT